MNTSVRRCRECSCTELQACPAGCYWIGPDLCSSCDPQAAGTAPADGGPAPDQLTISRSQLVVGDKRVKLSPSEAVVMKVLLANTGTLVELPTLHAALYSEYHTAAESNVLQVLVSRLRKKLASVGHRRAIETVRIRGYRFVAPEGGAA